MLQALQKTCVHKVMEQIRFTITSGRLERLVWPRSTRCRGLRLFISCSWSMLNPLIRRLTLKINHLPSFSLRSLTSFRLIWSELITWIYKTRIIFQRYRSTHVALIRSRLVNTEWAESSTLLWSEEQSIWRMTCYILLNYFCRPLIWVPNTNAAIMRTSDFDLTCTSSRPFPTVIWWKLLKVFSSSELQNQGK